MLYLVFSQWLLFLILAAHLMQQLWKLTFTMCLAVDYLSLILKHINEYLHFYHCIQTSPSITAPQDAHNRLVLEVAEGLTASPSEFKGGARRELTI